MKLKRLEGIQKYYLFRMRKIISNNFFLLNNKKSIYNLSTTLKARRGSNFEAREGKIWDLESFKEIFKHMALQITCLWGHLDLKNEVKTSNKRQEKMKELLCVCL